MENLSPGLNIYRDILPELRLPEASELASQPYKAIQSLDYYPLDESGKEYFIPNPTYMKR
jgi:hypothetical protein